MGGEVDLRNYHPIVVDFDEDQYNMHFNMHMELEDAM